MEETLLEIFEDLNQFDWVVLGVVVVSALFGMSRGFAREVTSFLGWIGAFVLANILALPVSETMSQIINDRSIRYITAWSGVFVAVLFFFGSVGRWLSNQLRQPGLNFRKPITRHRFWCGSWGYYSCCADIAVPSLYS